MRALFIGRFQPFHRGHLHALEEASEEHDVVIGIGSSQRSRTGDNPLTCPERRKVIRSCLDVETVPVPDQDDNDAWREHIQEHVEFDIVISGNDLVQSIFEDAGREVREPDWLEPTLFSGTEIRQRILEERDWKELVPDCALDRLEEFGFAELVRGAHENDG